jgi:hypothetical protein
MQRKPLLVISTAALLVALSAPVTFAKKKPPIKAPAIPQLSADEKVLHVLNRLTFGARSGDVEMVKQIGVEKYIDQQLHPEQITENPVLEAKVAPLDTLRLSVRDLNEKYPSNQSLKAMAEGRKPLPTDAETLAMIRRPLDRLKAKKDVTPPDTKEMNAPMVSM